MSKKTTPCDFEPYHCPYDVESGEGCRIYCGLGVDEDEPEDYYEREEYENE